MNPIRSKASGTDATMDAAISATTLVAAGVNLVFGIAVEAYLGVVISLVIVKAGIDILREALDKILGERMDSDLADRVRKTVEGVEGVRGAYDLTLNDYGPNRQMGSVHIEVDETMTARRIDALTREITTTVYRTCNVFIDAVGIYSTNVDDTSRVSSIRSRVNEIVWKHEHILEVHGFYLDDDARTISLDVVISFDEPHRASAAEAIREEIQAAFPEYVIELTLDTDYSN
ncbi:cation diffusion facilitator family transporter [Slackia exigua]